MSKELKNKAYDSLKEFFTIYNNRKSGTDSDSHMTWVSGNFEWDYSMKDLPEDFGARVFGKLWYDVVKSDNKYESFRKELENKKADPVVFLSGLLKSMEDNKLIKTTGMGTTFYGAFKKSQIIGEKKTENVVYQKVEELYNSEAQPEPSGKQHPIRKKPKLKDNKQDTKNVIEDKTEEPGMKKQESKGLVPVDQDYEQPEEEEDQDYVSFIGQVGGEEVEFENISRKDPKEAVKRIHEKIKDKELNPSDYFNIGTAISDNIDEKTQEEFLKYMNNPDEYFKDKQSQTQKNESEETVTEVKLEDEEQLKSKDESGSKDYVEIDYNDDTREFELSDNGVEDFKKFFKDEGKLVGRENYDKVMKAVKSETDDYDTKGVNDYISQAVEKESEYAKSLLRDWLVNGKVDKNDEDSLNRIKGFLKNEYDIDEDDNGLIEFDNTHLVGPIEELNEELKEINDKQPLKGYQNVLVEKMERIESQTKKAGKEQDWKLGVRHALRAYLDLVNGRIEKRIKEIEIEEGAQQITRKTEGDLKNKVERDVEKIEKKQAEAQKEAGKSSESKFKNNTYTQLNGMSQNYQKKIKELVDEPASDRNIKKMQELEENLEEVMNERISRQKAEGEKEKAKLIKEKLLDPYKTMIEDWKETQEEEEDSTEAEKAKKGLDNLFN